jgi:hypothetical protein
MDPKDVVEPLFSGLLYGTPDRKPQVFNNYKKPPMTPTGIFFPHSLLLIGVPTLFTHEIPGISQCHGMGLEGNLL